MYDSSLVNLLMEEIKIKMALYHSQMRHHVINMWDILKEYCNYYLYIFSSYILSSINFCQNDQGSS